MKNPQEVLNIYYVRAVFPTSLDHTGSSHISLLSTLEVFKISQNFLYLCTILFIKPAKT